MSAVSRILGFLLPSLVAENIRLQRRVSTLDAHTLKIETDHACLLRHTKMVEERMLIAERTLHEFGYTQPALRLIHGGRG